MNTDHISGDQFESRLNQEGQGLANFATAMFALPVAGPMASVETGGEQLKEAGPQGVSGGSSGGAGTPHMGTPASD